MILALLLSQLAFAAPTQIGFQGRLLDAEGTPVNGEHALTIGLHTEQTNGIEVWSTNVTVPVDDGYFHTTLTVDDALLAQALWVSTGVALGGSFPRQRLTSVPFSRFAETSTNVIGGTVQPGDSAATCDAASTGAIKWNTTEGALQVCDGGAWTTLYRALPAQTAATALADCKAIKTAHPHSTDGVYWIEPALLSGSPFQVYCDMTTDGGGWTLVGKVMGADHDQDSGILDATDTTRWVNKSYIGDITSLSVQNALGQSYESVPFTDFMLQGLLNSSRSLGWRMPSQHANLHATFNSSAQQLAQSVLFGDHSTLDWRSGCFAGTGPDATGPQFYGFNVPSDSGTGSGALFNGRNAGWCVSLAGWGRSNQNSYYSGGGLGARCQGRTHQMGRHYWGFGDGCNAESWNSSVGVRSFNAHGFFVR